MRRHTMSMMTELIQCALIVLVSGASLLAQASASTAVTKQFRDRVEYNLLNKIQSDSNPVHRIVLLNEWQERYPQSAFRQERFYVLLTTQQVLGRPHEMLRTAIAMADDDPLGLGNYWVCLITVQLRKNSSDALRRVEHSALSLLRNRDTMFMLVNKPEAVSTTRWEQQRQQSTALAHRALGWVAISREQWRVAEQQLVQVLGYDPRDAEASYWLGISIVGQRQPARVPAAIYHYARSLVVSGAGALSEKARGQVRSALEHSYSQCYRDEQGLAKLYRQAETAPFPPTRGAAALLACDHER